MDNELLKLLIEFFGEGNVEIQNSNRLERTINDMLSLDYKERFKAEYQQNLIRYQNLCCYLKEIENNKAKHDCPIQLLKKQLSVMKNYLDILVERSSIEGIDLV